MDKTICTLVALVLCLAMTASSELVPDESGGSIVEGEPISIEQAPWQVSLTDYHGTDFCGGAIISVRFIVTSAYCLQFKIAEDIKVRSGSIKRDKGGVVSKVKKIIRHEKFLRNKPHYDIALIMLSNPMKFGPTIAAINLYNPDEQRVVGIGEIIQFTGWGYTSEPGILSPKLLKVNIAIRPNTKCAVIYHAYNFCVGDREEHMASCNGDPGGPAVWKGYLYGIVSGRPGVACSEKEFTTPAERIADFYGWIIKNAV